jgi:hypothetical protein
MAGVVLRCPNCGTTKAAPGECQACHEAQVRYYCTSHTPGRWLDGAACSECGARFGEPARPPAPTLPARVRRPAPTPTGRPVERPRPWPAMPAGPWSRRPTPPPRDDAPSTSFGSDDIPYRRPPSWPEFLREAASRARRMRAAPEPVPDIAAVGTALRGCLMRAVLLMVFLFVVFLFFSLILGGLFFQNLGVYY